MKRIFKFIFIILALMLLNAPIAGASPPPGGSPPPSGGGADEDADDSDSGGSNAPYAAFFNLLQQPGVELHMGMTKTEFKICQVRRLFCGKMAVAIVAFATLLIGVLIADMHLTWPIAIILIAGIALFLNADKAAKTFGHHTWALLFLPNPLCDCSCTAADPKDCLPHT